MKFYFITFRSVTIAQRGEKLLSRENIRCTLQRTPRWMEEKGCGYALKVWTKDVIPVADLLRENGLTLRRVYVQRSDGKLEELTV